MLPIARRVLPVWVGGLTGVGRARLAALTDAGRTKAEAGVARSGSGDVGREGVVNGNATLRVAQDFAERRSVLPFALTRPALCNRQVDKL